MCDMEGSEMNEGESGDARLFHPFGTNIPSLYACILEMCMYHDVVRVYYVLKYHSIQS